MGLYDREYYRESNDQMSFGFGGQSATVTLVIINVAVFLVDWVLNLELAQWFGVRADTAMKPWLWFQYFTYGFLHATSGPYAGWHIFNNMFMLWMFGRMVENHYGKNEFMRVYLISIVLCGIAWNGVLMATMGTDVNAVMVGASGAVSTIFTMFVLMYPRMTLYVGFLIPVPAWVVGIFLLLSNMFGQDTSVAYSAHLAGIGFGAAYYFGKWNFAGWIPGWLPSKLTWPNWFRKRPKLRVHVAEEDEEPNPYNDSDEDAERLLDKVRDKGMEALSPAERRKLEAYSRRMRQKLR